MVSFVWFLWPGSVIFTAVLSYRIGAYWSSDDSPGRHRAGMMSSQDDPWDDDFVEDEVDRPLRPLPPLPVRWWSDEDDTEVLPQIGDEWPEP
ncbi:hypothetical protein ACQP0C_27735 [Nocardia sp. CA-129566]|uniref:hypothetical protein n=1 Tax=Nocardia sp. CA-129566 TaxID=3239976 RepID=UPI003D980048